MTALAGALRDNTALTRLGLAANVVREEGAGALGAMLAGNRRLHCRALACVRRTGSTATVSGISFATSSSTGHASVEHPRPARALA